LTLLGEVHWLAQLVALMAFGQVEDLPPTGEGSMSGLR
jgi:hypothetical protein